MTGRELFDNYTSQRDFSGTASDNYAQTLMSIFAQIRDEIYPLLEKAEAEGKKLDIKAYPIEEQYEHDEILASDIILV